MPKRRLAIEIVFDDDFALLDFQEHVRSRALVELVDAYLAEHLDGRARVETGVAGSEPLLAYNNIGREWTRVGPPRPSEIAIARVMAKEHPGKTHEQVARERLERVDAEKEEQRRKDAEFAAALAAEEEADDH